MSSKYKQLLEVAKSYSFAEILESKNFMLVDEKISADGRSPAKIWENNQLEEAIQIITGAEDEDCYLLAKVSVSEMKLNKLELIKLLHAGGNWEVLSSLLTNGTPLREHPLLEIGRINMAIEDDNGEKSLENKILGDPHLRELAKKRKTEIEIYQVAKTQFENEESSRNSQNLLSMETSERIEKLGLLEWEKIWDMALEDDWIVPGFLSFERSHLIYGQSGLGKSLLTQEIAACASAGKSILGFPAKEPISVLYLDNENTALGDVRPRLREMGFSPEELANLTYLSFPNIPDLNSKSGGEIFNQLLEMYQPKLVILDTFSRFVDGEENSSATVQEFYKWCGKVMKKLKIAYIRIDHMGKDPEKEARGSSAKRDDVDLIWLMKEVTPNGRFELINKKSRVLIAEDRLILDRTSNPLSHRILSGIDWATLIAEAAKPDTALALITEYVAKNPSSRLGRTAVWTALKAKCNSEGISRKTLWDAIERYRSGEVDSDWLKEASIEI